MVDFKIGGHFSHFPVDLLTSERDQLETKCQAARSDVRRRIKWCRRRSQTCMRELLAVS